MPMTIKRLSQLYYLNSEIEQDKRRLAELESVASGITTKITGLPHGTDISDKTAIAAEIADLKVGIEAKIKLTFVEYNRLMRYIDTVDDSLMRQILTLRHINGLSWERIGQELSYSESGIRKKHGKFLKECGKCGR